jgi:hypothetical protein
MEISAAVVLQLVALPWLGWTRSVPLRHRLLADTLKRVA